MIATRESTTKLYALYWKVGIVVTDLLVDVKVWLLVSATFNVVGWLDAFVCSREMFTLGLILDSRCFILVGLPGGV